jgi:hypothetical protein
MSGDPTSVPRQSTNGHVSGVEAYGEEHRYSGTARRYRWTRLLLPATAAILVVAVIRILQRTGEL